MRRVVLIHSPQKHLRLLLLTIVLISILLCACTAPENHHTGSSTREDTLSFSLPLPFPQDNKAPFFLLPEANQRDFYVLRHDSLYLYNTGSRRYTGISALPKPLGRKHHYFYQLLYGQEGLILFLGFYYQKKQVHLYKVSKDDNQFLFKPWEQYIIPKEVILPDLDLYQYAINQEKILLSGHQCFPLLLDRQSKTGREAEGLIGDPIQDAFYYIRAEKEQKGSPVSIVDMDSDTIAAFTHPVAAQIETQPGLMIDVRDGRFYIKMIEQPYSFHKDSPDTHRPEPHFYHGTGLLHGVWFLPGYTGGNEVMILSKNKR